MSREGRIKRFGIMIAALFWVAVPLAAPPARCEDGVKR
jgi:hypothetical protein